MDRQGLPGIEDLFREQERLAKKLSHEELNALRRFVRRAVHAECESVVARMRFLQAAHDVNERQFRQALDMLQKDLTREKTVASEFKREFASLSRVLQAREQRHNEQHDVMVAEVRHSRTAAEEARKKTEELEALVQLKEKELLRNKDMVVDLEDELVKHKNCLQIKDEAERLRRDVLRLKVDNEALRKRLSADTPRLGGWEDGPMEGLQRMSGTKENGSERTKVGPGGPELKSRNQVTAAPVSPYCSSPTCRALRDLEECRALYVRKCQEVVHLTEVIAQRQQTSREQIRPSLSNPGGIGYASVAARSFQRGQQSLRRCVVNNKSLANSGALGGSGGQAATQK